MMVKYLRLLLLPFSLIYGLVIWLRNKFYDWGIFKSKQFDLPVICVGNLAVGGSGKTPTIEYLIRLLGDKKIAVLSRGYGRKTKGFLLADENATAQTIGDEPLQYFKKFKNITVAVCEDRVKGVELLKQNHDIILLDDAFQHRALKAGFNILLFEFAKLQQMQFLLPAGNLREPFYACSRADEILITKSPQLFNDSAKREIEKKFSLNADQNLSFSSIKYGDFVHLFNTELKREISNYEIFLLTGIANPKPLIAYLKESSPRIHHFEFPDHHDFSSADIKQLVNAFNEHVATEKIIITTEKDSQRLLSDNLKDLLLNLPIFYLPIEIELKADDKYNFDQKILNYVASAKGINRVS